MTPAKAGPQPPSTAELLRIVREQAELLHMTRDFAYRHDTAGVFTYLSPSIEAITGYSVDEWRTHYTTYLTDHPDNAKVVEYTERTLRTGEQSPSYRVEVRHRDGHPVMLEVNERAYRDEQGQVAGIVGVARDISDRVAAETARARAEAAQRASEERYRVMVDAMASPLVVLGLDGRLQFINAKGAANLGGHPGDFIGRLMAEILPELEATIRERLARVARNGETLMVEDGVELPGGKRWFASTLQALRDGTGRVTAVEVVSHDITERRRAEEALRASEDEVRRLNRVLEERVRQRTAELHASEEKFRSLVEQAADALYVHDLEGRIRDINARACEMTGYDRETLLSMGVDQIERGSGLARMKGHWNGLAEGEVLTVEGRQQHRDGHLFPVEVRLRRIALGGETLILALVRDITVRQNLEWEVAQIADREQRRIGQDLHDSLGQVLAGAAFMAKAQRDRLGEGTEASASARIAECLDEAMGQVRRLARGLLPVTTQRGGLAAALEVLCADLQAVWGLRCRLQPSTPVTIDDPAVANNLYRIAQEALHNAVRHSGARLVQIRLDHQDGQLVLAVTDDGRGLAAPEGRGPTTPGTGGLGLAIMAYRAHMIGADLTVENRPEGGVAVRCLLPWPREG